MGMHKLEKDEDKVDDQSLINIKHIDTYLAYAKTQFLPKLSDAYRLANNLSSETRNSKRKEIAKIFSDLETLNSRLWLRFYKSIIRDRIMEHSNKFGILKDSYEKDINVEEFQKMKEGTLNEIIQSRNDVNSLIEFLEAEKNLLDQQVIQRKQHLKRIK